MSFLLGLVAALNGAIPVSAASPTPALGNLSSMIGELRKGGYVIFFRHSATDLASDADEANEMTKCDTQRHLSLEGRRQATELGKAFVAQRIPVGIVTTSEFCRCKETATLAFGHFKANVYLSSAIKTDATETRRAAEILRRMLATAPAAATNSIIVSHSSNLREATGLWPGEGVAYVFRPLPEGKFEVVARVLPRDWIQLASGRAGK